MLVVKKPKKKLTGKDISTADVPHAVGDGETFGEMAKKLGLTTKTDRALDQALQREKRAGTVRFDRAERRWVKAAAGSEKKPKRGGRKS